MDFLTSGNHCFLFIFQTPLSAFFHIVENYFSIIFPLLEIEKIEENCLTSNLNHYAHQPKKAPNKIKNCVSNRNSVSTSQNERFVEKFHCSEKLLPFESVSEKKNEENGSSSINKTFLRYWSPSNCSNGFQKNLNEKISFSLNRKSVATSCSKQFIKKLISKRWKNFLQWNVFLRFGNKMVSTGQKLCFH